jgi:hypothetical protein
LGLSIKEHIWRDEENFGYRDFETAEDLTRGYHELIKKLKILVEGGLCAAVYTQMTDVEIEVNGLMTYEGILDLTLFNTSQERKELSWREWYGCSLDSLEPREEQRVESCSAGFCPQPRFILYAE